MGMRRSWIDGMIENDIFYLSRDMGLIEYLTSRSNQRVQTVSLALMSMIASSESGTAYLTKSKESMSRYLDIIQKVPELTVAHRFGLAVLHKLSYSRSLANQMIESKADNYISEFLTNYSSKKTHSFFPIFYTALAYNMFSNPDSRDKISRFATRYAPLLMKLLDFFKNDIPSSAHQNILQLFKYFLVEKEVYFRDLMMECKASDTLRVYSNSLQSMFKGMCAYNSVDRKNILDHHIEQFSSTLKKILDEDRPKISDKEALKLRKNEKLMEEEIAKMADKPRKVLDFEIFKDEILEDELI